MSESEADTDPIAGDTQAECLLGGGRRTPNGDPATRQISKEDVARVQAGESVSVEQQEQWCLVQIYPADVVGGMKLIDKDRFTIGRDPQSDLCLDDHGVSRRHAVILRQQHDFVVKDLGSTNGTFVDGGPIDQLTLKSGDTIRFGGFLLKFLSAGSLESQYHETVYSALTRDALTGTMNKRYLLETLGRTIATAVRQENPVSIIMLDIDHFKSINDTHGHLVGDEVLREFGRRLCDSLREEDLVARYGGEEFCVLLSATNGWEAAQAAERCRLVIESNPFATAAGSLKVTASFGIASLDPVRNESGLELIGRADKSLYNAKRNGRNRVGKEVTER